VIGSVAIVGAGPGDPELLTLRAVRRLAAAEVVLHDALVAPQVLALAPQARRIDVGKRAAGRRTEQVVIERLLIRLARRGQRVVRLKGGDPFIFGRGGEEALALAAAGVPFEIVPGLSSALAGPALCGIPLTHRGVSAALVVVSGHDLGAAQQVLAPLLPGSATIVVLMGRERRVELAQLLLRCGWSAQTAAAVVQSASLPSQSEWRGSLSELAEPQLRSQLDPAAPSLLVIGEAVAMAATQATAVGEKIAA
jgi:uroporphyrin-III C-methyltransferase/precorrin-2 dehydrogenase/sirohydrochlorin ferrochelatase